MCNRSGNSTIKRLFFLQETDIHQKTKAMFDFLPSFFIHRVSEFFFLKQLVSKSFPSFCRIMINCEDLVIADGQVVRQLLKDFDVSPESMLPLNSFEEFENRLKLDKKLMKVYYSLKDLYEQCDQSGFKILPDKFGGFGLFNHTGRVLKPSLEPLRPFPVGPVKNVPAELQNEMSDLSVIRGELDADEQVLLGPIRFANHSCSPNTQFFLGYTSPFLPHNKCVFLKVITSVQPYEEITVSYGSNFSKMVG